MLFLEIFVNNSFIFFRFSAFTVLQTWFLSYGNQYSFQTKISLNFLVSFLLYVLVFVRCGVSILLCSSFQFECSCFSVFGVSIIVLGSYCFDSLFTFWCISNISRTEDQPFFIIVLTGSTSLWLVVRNLAHSSKILIIIFL